MAATIGKSNAAKAFEAVGLEFHATKTGGKVGEIAWNWFGKSDRLPPATWKALRNTFPAFNEKYPAVVKAGPKGGGKRGKRKITTVEQLAGYTVAELDTLAGLIPEARRLAETAAERASLESTIKALEAAKVSTLEELRAKLASLQAPAAK